DGDALPAWSRTMPPIALSDSTSPLGRASRLTGAVARLAERFRDLLERRLLRVHAEDQLDHAADGHQHAADEVADEHLALCRRSRRPCRTATGRRCHPALPSA